MVGQRFRYSRWDGSQKGFDFDADDLWAQMSDDLAYHGDPMAALRRMLQDGFEDRNGEQIQGLRDLLEQIRRERAERLENNSLGGPYDEIADRLGDIVDAERQALADRRALAEMEQADPDSTDAQRRNAELAEQSASEREMGLNLLPDDLAGQVRSLQSHQFESASAAQDFQDLLDELRKELVDTQFGQMSEAMSQVTPEDLARMRDMMAELNEMLEQRARGEEPDFEGFMDRYGDVFPGNPSSLDELLEQMAQQMAAMSALLASMTPEQRQQLMDLSQQLMGDMDFNFEVSRLSQNLQGLFPDMGWGQSYEFSGGDPLGLSQASQMMAELGQLDSLEQFLSQASSPGALSEVDIDQARELLGDDASRSLERLSELTKMLEDAGLVNNTEGRLELTPRGLRKLGQNALGEIFKKLSADKVGQHTMDRSGIGVERSYQTRAYEWGDPFNLDIGATVANAVRRRGGGTPVRLTPDDFEIEQTERTTRSSTVLMLDLSLSMPMRDNFLPAKKVALALHSLISSQFPRDYLGIVSFSEVAREIKAAELPAVSWDYVYGTNMQHAFALSRKMLAAESGTKQIIMITDGEPTAHIRPDGYPEFNYPPTSECVRATLGEVARCTRDGIRINTFMLDPDRGLRSFVERLTELNKGRAFFTTPQTLGDYLLVDFIEHKRSLLGDRRRSA